LRGTWESDSEGMTPREPGTPSVPLRRRLLLLAAVGIVPLAVMAGISLYALTQQHRVQVERVGMELTRAVATAVDAELRSTMSVLEALATTVALDRQDLPAFRERAHRVLSTQPQWAALMLATPSGTRLFDTRYGHDRPLPPIAEGQSFDRLVRTRTPVVGNLARNPEGALLFPVRVPVLRNGELRYVLTAIVKPEEIREVLARQGVSGDWVISIFDANGRRVARSRAHEENLGGEPSPTLRTLMASGDRERFAETYALEGDRIYTAYSRIEPSGWSAALGIPAAVIEAARYRSLAVYGGGVFLSIALGTVAAIWVARSISHPIADLRAAAQALGRREPLVRPATSIQEIRDVAATLVAAADERMRSEAHREGLLRREQEARATAEAADRAKDEFLAVLSHELRTPLNAVYGWARMLRTGQIQGTEPMSRALEVIERNANVQVQLVDDLLDVSRVITGKMRLDVRAVDLRTVVEAALDAVRPAADAKGIRLQAVLDPRAGPITGDPDRLQQVVWNLLINAVKFTPKGGRVQVHLQRINSHVEIVVSDTGQGIAADLLPVIFERFRQADSSSTRIHTGLGLGLALVKHLVELHGGSVVAQSTGEGHGATFVVKLPLTIANVPAGPVPRVHPTAPSRESHPRGARLDGLRVLLVDDEPDAVDLATAILASAGAEVRTCRSAAEALDAVRGWRPDVLVSDIEMPEEDGYSLIRRVRALGADEGGKTPAVALTAYGRTQDRMQSLAAGYSMHVPKPVDPGELTTIIASLSARPPRRAR
jgi:signal transduction histidine kinase/ActR/RegA family two-component response regulator